MIIDLSLAIPLAVVCVVSSASLIGKDVSNATSPWVCP